MKRHLLVLVWMLLAVMTFSACSLLGGEEEIQPQQPGLPDNPEPATGAITEGEAPVEAVEVLILESFPLQVQARVTGYLPDGCTQLGDTVVTQEGNTFRVALKTARPSDAVCTEAVVPFEVTVPLPVEGLPAGDYTVNVNGQTATFGMAVDNVLPSEGEPPTADPGAAECPQPEGAQGQHVDAEAGFCFVYPEGFEVNQPEPGVTVVLGPIPEDAGPEPLAAFLNIDVQDAAGRTAQEIVDQQLAAYTGIDITQTPMTLDGEPAIALDGVPGLFSNRQIFIVRGSTLYILTFVPVGDEYGETYGQMQSLFNAVTSTWRWLPAQ